MHVAGPTLIFWAVAMGMGFAVLVVVITLLNLLLKSVRALDTRVDHVWEAAAGVHAHTALAGPQLGAAERQLVGAVSAVKQALGVSAPAPRPASRFHVPPPTPAAPAPPPAPAPAPAAPAPAPQFRPPPSAPATGPAPQFRPPPPAPATGPAPQFRPSGASGPQAPAQPAAPTAPQPALPKFPQTTGPQKRLEDPRFPTSLPPVPRAPDWEPGSGRRSK